MQSTYNYFRSENNLNTQQLALHDTQQNFQQIPEEMQTEIVHRVSNADLQSLQLVSKKMQQLASPIMKQRILDGKMIVKTGKTRTYTLESFGIDYLTKHMNTIFAPYKGHESAIGSLDLSALPFRLFKDRKFSSMINNEIVMKFINLKQLIIPNCTYDDDELRSLTQLSQLRDLSIGAYYLTSKGFKLLSEFVNLKHLEISNCPYLDEDGLKSIAQLKQLKTLHIINTPLGQITNEGYKIISNLLNLRNLKIAYAYNMQDLSWLAELNHLNSLDIEHADLSSLLIFPPNLAIAKLTLHSCFLEDDGLASLASSL